MRTTFAAAVTGVAKWRTVGDWKIGFFRTGGAFRKAGLGSFMGTQYSRGTILVLGFGAKAGGGYVGVSNDAWDSFEGGNEYQLALKFNDDTSWRGMATGVGNPVFLIMPFDKPDFLVDFARKKSVSIAYAGKNVTQLPLRGTYAAVQELLSCQEALIGERDGPPQGDPVEN